MIVLNVSTSRFTFTIIEVPARIWHSWKILSLCIEVASTSSMVACTSISSAHMVDYCIHINMYLENSIHILRKLLPKAPLINVLSLTSCPMPPLAACLLLPTFYLKYFSFINIQQW